MYTNLKGSVIIDGLMGEWFAISIGLRQGCNLSPHLFNLYIDDFVETLNQQSFDPVKLGGY